MLILLAIIFYLQTVKKLFFVFTNEVVKV